eukprot:gene48317-60106_t
MPPLPNAAGWSTQDEAALPAPLGDGTGSITAEACSAVQSAQWGGGAMGRWW